MCLYEFHCLGQVNRIPHADRIDENIERTSPLELVLEYSVTQLSSYLVSSFTGPLYALALKLNQLGRHINPNEYEARGVYIPYFFICQGTLRVGGNRILIPLNVLAYVFVKMSAVPRIV